MNWKSLAVFAAGALLVTGCSANGGSSGGTGGGGGSSDLGLQQSGTLHLAADFSVPPNQWLEGGQQKGIDPDLCSAMAKQMKLKVQWTNLTFDSLISGLEAHRYDALCTGVFITAEREQVMNMVPYVQWGVTMGVPKAQASTLSCTDKSNNYQSCFAKFAGKKVATESGGFEEQVLKDANTKLQAAGKQPMKILGFSATTDAWQALSNGTADAVWVDDPQFYYFNGKSGNKFAPAFGDVQPTPLALTTTKNNKALADAIVKALKAMKASGEYSAILKKWHVQPVPSFTINPPAQ